MKFARITPRLPTVNVPKTPTQNAGTAYSVLSIISVIFVANFESPVHFFWGSIWILEAAMRRASGCRMHDVNCNQATLARRAGGPTSDRGNSISQRNADPQRESWQYKKIHDRGYIHIFMAPQICYDLHMAVGHNAAPCYTMVHTAHSETSARLIYHQPGRATNSVCLCKQRSAAALHTLRV